jgi:hypothetical protein
MLGSRVLELAIGLTFCYATLALIVSTLQEGLAALFQLRANSLLAGVRSMLNDPHCTGLAGALYRHPLVNPHADSNHRPSYIEPQHFALALVDAISHGSAELANLKVAIDAVPDPNVRRALLALYGRADGDLKRFFRMASPRGSTAPWRACRASINGAPGPSACCCRCCCRFCSISTASICSSRCGASPA